MANKKEGSNRIAVVLITVVVISVIIAAVVIILYYVKKNNKPDDSLVNQMAYVDISDNRIDLLFKHISLMDPLVNNMGLYQMKDLDDDLKLKIVIEDLIYTNEYTNVNDNSISLKIDDILQRALILYNTKTYDYYPDAIDYYNYHFEKKGNEYIGTKNDILIGKYTYLDIKKSVVNDTLYLVAKIGYYEDENGAYNDSIRTIGICQGKGCIQKVDLNTIEQREIYANYKIINNQFIFVSASVSELNP